MQRKKILQVNKLYSPYIGGVEKFMKMLTEGLHQYFDVDVLVCQAKGKREVSEINGIEVTRTKSYGIVYSMPMSIQFLTEFRKRCNDYDVITLHAPFPIGDVALLLSGYKGKVVVWWHSDIVRQKKFEFFYKPFLEHTLKRADQIQVATEGHIIHSKYLSRYREKCKVIPYPVDGYFLEEAQSYLEEQKRSALIEEQVTEVRFLYVGRLVYYKGCKVLLEAFAKADLENAKLTMVGNGPLYEELQVMASEMGIRDKVEFLTEIDDQQLAEQYKKCDAFVLASIAPSEAFGLVQTEAMSFGKPVINTNLKSGVPWVGEHGVTGYTVEPESVEELAEALKTMYENPEKRKEMGIHAREFVEQKYSTEIFHENIEEVYNKL